MLLLRWSVSAGALLVFGVLLLILLAGGSAARRAQFHEADSSWDGGLHDLRLVRPPDGTLVTSLSISVFHLP
jgi:hypothetical protein